MIDKEDIYRYITFSVGNIYICFYGDIYIYMNIHEYLISPYMMIDIKSPYFFFRNTPETLKITKKQTKPCREFAHDWDHFGGVKY